VRARINSSKRSHISRAAVLSWCLLFLLICSIIQPCWCKHLWPWIWLKPRKFQLLSHTHRYDFHIPLFDHLGCLHTIIFEAHIETNNWGKFRDVRPHEYMPYHAAWETEQSRVPFSALNAAFTTYPEMQQYNITRTLKQIWSSRIWENMMIWTHSY